MITQIVREIDPKQKFAFASKNETYGIYGYSDFSPSQTHKSQLSAPNQQSNIKRLILKTDNDKANDLSVKLRRSLLKKCQNLIIRTDI